MTREAGERGDPFTEGVGWGKDQGQGRGILGCARFPKFVQNFSEPQILWSLCSVDFHTFTLQLPIQTLHSVVPE